jgi:hypothetical protein
MGKPVCSPHQGVVISPKAVAPNPQPIQDSPVYDIPAAVQPQPVESQPVIVPQQAPPVQDIQPIIPEPLPQEPIQEFSLPIPAPPAEADASKLQENPFLTVSQIEESEGSEDAADNPFAQDDVNKEPRPVGPHLSKAWSDALGLPVAAPASIEHYRRNE